MTEKRVDYWDVLADASKLMEKAPACAECMQQWRTHGPRHYSAHRNVKECRDCAIRTVEPVERAMLDWQYENDPLKVTVRRLIGAFRVLAASKMDLRDVLSRWSEYLEAAASGKGPAPETLRDERLDARVKAEAVFWQCMKDLNLAVPGRGKEETK